VLVIMAVTVTVTMTAVVAVNMAMAAAAAGLRAAVPVPVLTIGTVVRAARIYHAIQHAAKKEFTHVTSCAHMQRHRNSKCVE
jgi:hypothetical protein